jgi:hypothetical protein
VDGRSDWPTFAQEAERLAELRWVPRWSAIPVIVVTSMELGPEDRARLQGSVEKVLRKGDHGRESLLREVRALVERTLVSPRAAP